MSAFITEFELGPLARIHRSSFADVEGRISARRLWQFAIAATIQNNRTDKKDQRSQVPSEPKPKGHVSLIDLDVD
jgi:hypothetical protein